MTGRTRTKPGIAVTTGAPDPHRRQEIESYLDSRRVKWTYVPDMKVSEFDVNRSMANNARFEALHEHLVEEYTESIKRGDLLPAVIASYVGKKLVIIDGNHRLNAFIAAGKETVPVYIIEADAQTVTIMTYEANTKHGLRTSDEERIQHALWLMDRGTTQPKAAQITGLSLNKIKSAWERSKSEARARQMSIRDWNTLTVGVRSRLGAVRTDEGFEACAKLALEAQLSAEEVNDLVVEVNKERGGGTQVAKVNDIRDRLYIDRIQRTGGGTVKRYRNTPFTLFRSGAGMLVKNDIETILNDLHTPAEMETVLKSALQVQDQAQALVKALTKRIAETEQ